MITGDLGMATGGPEKAIGGYVWLWDCRIANKGLGIVTLDFRVANKDHGMVT